MTSFQTSAFQIFHPSKHWNSKNHPYKYLNSDCYSSEHLKPKWYFFQKFWYYASKHWNSGLIHPNIGILSVHLHALEFWPYCSKQFNWLYPSKHLSCDLTFSKLILEFWPFPSKHWNCDLLPPNTGIVTRSFQRNGALIFPNIGSPNVARQRSQLLSIICR